ncbi:MAG: TonB-dependent receptor, partial [Verrucomicrobia bacterium]
MSIILSSAIASSLWSQATPSGDSEEEGDDLIQLSPFVVTEDESVGYAATSTLAGTRIKTELKDLGAAISVVTPEFMEDTGATNVEELFAYTTNTEVGGLQGNFSAADLGANSQRYNLDEQRREPQSGTRIRGLSRPNFTRDYFSTSIPIDAYNTGQITMNRGANSLLFGLGSAAGVVNAGLRRTVLSKNSGQVGFRFDQEGSYRAWVDYNQMIIPKRVAVRVDALAKEDVYKQDPAFDREKRAYIAMDAILLENENSRIFGPTTLRASYEIGAGKRTP